MSEDQAYRQGLYHGYHGDNMYDYIGEMTQNDRNSFERGYDEGNRRRRDGWNSPYSQN